MNATKDVRHVECHFSKVASYLMSFVLDVPKCALAGGLSDRPLLKMTEFSGKIFVQRVQSRIVSLNIPGFRLKFER